jgi:hypothetical protein
MELALCVIGQMASREEHGNHWVLGPDSGGGLGTPRFYLVHRYLDRCGVAEVA